MRVLKERSNVGDFVVKDKWVGRGRYAQVRRKMRVGSIVSVSVERFGYVRVDT